MKLMRWAAIALIGWVAAASGSAESPSAWNRPAAAALCDQISGILGPGQARLTIRNLSSVSSDAIPAIRKLLEQDLKGHGITLAGDEGANNIRITLSENATARLWVAEVMEGNATQVAIVDAGPAAPPLPAAGTGLTLRLQTIFTSREPVLSALETSAGWIVLEPEQFVFYVRAADGFHAQSHSDIGLVRSLPRDPRGILRIDTSQTQFTAFLAGAECSGPTSLGQSPGEWSVNCHTGDDPWPIQESNASAFYNSVRNYFTGVVTPSLGAELPAFYTAASIPRAANGTALVIEEVDGKLRLLENNALQPVSGTRDWGSDFAVLHSGCGSGTQIIASGSGQASVDSLRAYELPSLEAISASPTLEVSGSVTALWPATDGRSVLAVVERTPNQYEVDRVSALCN